MKYLLCFVLVLLGAWIAGTPLYYTHTLRLQPFAESTFCFSFAFYLFDPTAFLTFSADMRESAKAYLRRGAP